MSQPLRPSAPSSGSGLSNLGKPELLAIIDNQSKLIQSLKSQISSMVSAHEREQQLWLQGLTACMDQPSTETKPKLQLLTKACSGPCKQTKPLGEFSMCSRTADKHQAWCKQCTKENKDQRSQEQKDLGITYSCPYCVEVVKHKTSLTRHIKNQHPNKPEPVDYEALKKTSPQASPPTTPISPSP